MPLFSSNSARITATGIRIGRVRRITGTRLAAFGRLWGTVAALLMMSPIFESGIVLAQSATWSTPSSGFIYDSGSQSIRSLTGFIGAATLGPPAVTGIDWAAIAPNAKSAIAEQNGAEIWIPDLTSPAVVQSLDRIPLSQEAFWASDSSQAVILAAGGQLIWLNNFSSGPVSVSTWNLQSYTRAVSANSGVARNLGDVARSGPPPRRATWTLLAADSSADRVLLALHNGETWQLWFASSTVPPQMIPFDGHPVAAAFAPATGGVYVADAAGHRLVQIQNPGSNPVLTTVIASDVYIHDPAALALSSDGNRLFVADHTDSMIRAFDSGAATGAASAPIAELPTSAAPVSLTVFAPDRYRINTVATPGQSPGQPLFFLDTGVPSTVLFVPGEQ
jgi:hypothetical protein